MIGSAEDEGSFEGLLQLLVINLSFPVLEDLSALVVHGQPEDDNIALMPDVEGDVVTLTHLPRSRWQTLLNLDVIQVSSSTFLCISCALTHFGLLATKQTKRAPKGSREGTIFPAYCCRRRSAVCDPRERKREDVGEEVSKGYRKCRERLLPKIVARAQR